MANEKLIFANRHEAKQRRGVHLVHLFRFVRYSVVGVGVGVSLLYSVITIAVLNLFGFRLPTIASTIAFLLVIPVSFYAHRRLSFRDANRDGSQSFRFAFIAVSSFIVAVGGMHLVTRVWDLHYLSGIALAWILIPLVNFLINSFWVFPLPPAVEPISEIASSTSLSTDLPQ